MTDKEIVERAKKAEKRTGFVEVVHSPISKGVNSAFGIGFIEGMVEYRNSLQEEPVSEELEKAAEEYAYTNWASDDYHEGAAEGLPFDAIGHTEKCFKAGANWQKGQMMANTVDATIGLPYENKDGGYTHLIDVSRPLPVGNNKITIIFKED